MCSLCQLICVPLTASSKGGGDVHLFKEAEKIVHRGHVCSQLQLTHFLRTSKGEDKAAALLHRNPASAACTVDFLGQTPGRAGASETLQIPQH